MHAQKSLKLNNRFKFTHAPLSNPCWLVRELHAIVGILKSIVNRIRNEFSVRDTMTS